MPSISKLMQILKASGGRGKDLIGDIAAAGKSSFGKGAGVLNPAQGRMGAFGTGVKSAVKKAPVEAALAAGGVGAAGLGAGKMMSDNDEDDNISEYLKKKLRR